MVDPGFPVRDAYSVVVVGGGGATSDMGAVWQKKIVKTKELAPVEGRPEYANVCDYRSTTRGHSKHCSHRVTCPCISGHLVRDKICWFLPCLVLCSDKIVTDTVGTGSVLSDDRVLLYLTGYTVPCSCQLNPSVSHEPQWPNGHFLAFHGGGQGLITGG